MSDEDKKGIEYLKDFITKDKKIVENLCEIECEYYDEELDYIEQRIGRFETILNLIEKQQKEIEELKIINNMQKYRIEIIDERELIPKQKIRDKIEELNNNKEDCHFYICSDDIKRTIKTNLEQLLEEEE